MKNEMDKAIELIQSVEPQNVQSAVHVAFGYFDEEAKSDFCVVEGKRKSYSSGDVTRLLKSLLDNK